MFKRKHSLKDTGAVKADFTESFKVHKVFYRCLHIGLKEISIQSHNPNTNLNFYIMHSVHKEMQLQSRNCA